MGAPLGEALLSSLSVGGVGCQLATFPSLPMVSFQSLSVSFGVLRHARVTRRMPNGSPEALAPAQ